MEHEVLKDFVLEKKASKETIEKYRDKLPIEIIEVWEQYGFGSFLKGFYRTIDPDDYIEILRATYLNNTEAIPVMTTGMGDIVTWENRKLDEVVLKYKGMMESKNLKIGENNVYYKMTITDDYHFELVNYRRNCSINIPRKPNFFFRDLSREFVLHYMMDCEPYFKLIQEHGIPKYDSCFCFGPIYPEGKELTSKVYIGNIKINADLVSQFLGPIVESMSYLDLSKKLDKIYGKNYKDELVKLDTM